MRSHTCGALRKEQIGERVRLAGWVDRTRNHGNLIFIDLRDRFGITQLVCDLSMAGQVHEEAERLRGEWVIQAVGVVSARGEGLVNPTLSTGEIEVRVEAIEVLSKAKTPPFVIGEAAEEVNEELRLRYRYLDLRRKEMIDRLVTRHTAMRITREVLSSHRFIEVSTPILGKSTPEGARDYLVPSRIHPGSFYALPQSPQLFKQLLMCAGLDRYFQIAACFRDEDLRADRQPEFTQIDLEMSFSQREELFAIIEELIARLFLECRGTPVSLPIARMAHKECIERYGTDRPDLRFGMSLVDLTALAAESAFPAFHEQIAQGAIVKGFVIPGGAEIPRRKLEEYETFVQGFGAKVVAWAKCQEGGLATGMAKAFNELQQKALIAQAEMNEGDLLIAVAAKASATHQSLDHLRRRIAKERAMIPEGLFCFTWVIDFPLFGYDDEDHRLLSEHHPFTSPLGSDLDLLESEPLKVRSSGYDLVVNGYEIGGGSQRIHNAELQHKIFSLLSLSDEEIQEKFGFFVDALGYGAPPHMGIALGLDRLIMLLTGTENIRDVIAFPKTQKATDLMLQAPSPVADQQMKELHIRQR